MYGGARHRAPQGDGGEQHGDSVAVQMDGLLDESDAQIDLLRQRVGALKSITRRIDEETQVQNKLVDSLQAAMSQAQVAMQRTMRRVDRAFKNPGTNTIALALTFAVLLFCAIYFFARLV